MAKKVVATLKTGTGKNFTKSKKVVATLKTGTGKNFTKCIKMVKSDKTGAYMFKEGIIPNDQVKEFFEEKK